MVECMKVSLCVGRGGQRTERVLVDEGWATGRRANRRHGTPDRRSWR